MNNTHFLLLLLLAAVLTLVFALVLKKKGLKGKPLLGRVIAFAVILLLIQSITETVILNSKTSEAKAGEPETTERTEKNAPVLPIENLKEIQEKTEEIISTANEAVKTSEKQLRDSMIQTLP